MNTKLILSIFTLLLFVSSPMAYADVKSIWGGQEKKEVVKDKNGNKKTIIFSIQPPTHKNGQKVNNNPEQTTGIPPARE